MEKPSGKPAYKITDVIELQRQILETRSDMRILERANLADHRMMYALVIASLLIAAIAAVVAVLV